MPEEFAKCLWEMAAMSRWLFPPAGSSLALPQHYRGHEVSCVLLALRNHWLVTCYGCKNILSTHVRCSVTYSERCTSLEIPVSKEEEKCCFGGTGLWILPAAWPPHFVSITVPVERSSQASQAPRLCSWDTCVQYNPHCPQSTLRPPASQIQLPNPAACSN